MPNVQIFETPELLARAAAHFFVALAQTATLQQLFSVALSGGQTPRRVYELLATDEFKDQIKWELVHIFFGDERPVPSADAASNYGMAYAALLSKVPIPDSHIHPIGSGGRLPSILIVDDDPLIRQIIRDVLTEEGFAVATAADGPQALRRAADRPPALVILDMGLPRMDGYEVAVALRAAHGRALPILTITADGGAANKAQRVGAFAYLRKPFDLDDLVAAVRGVLRAD